MHAPDRPGSDLVSACRSCGVEGLSVFLSLGRTPLANALLTDADLDREEPTYPLEAALCEDCSLVQITTTVPPEVMFRDYPYFSSVSETMLRHARESAEQWTRERSLGPDSLVVEIASNDGYLLKNFVAGGVPVLGIDPARNVARAAAERGVPTLAEFFGRELAGGLAAEGKRADLILANNVMAHVPDVNGVVAGVKLLLRPGGAFVMETPYVRDLVDRLEFDTIYHEHLFYYSLTALEALFRRHGLAASRVERLPIHGGSLRVTAVHEGREGDRPEVRALLKSEADWGVGRPEAFRDFGARVGELRGALRGLIETLRDQGKRLAAYGAAAKGSTLLNFIGVGRESLDFVADRSPAKQGRYMPGVRVPIVPPGRLVEALPDYTLLLTWNFAEEILAQQAEYRRLGGRFIIPLPKPIVV